MHDFPSVAHISNVCPGDEGPGEHLLSRLYADWPRERLACFGPRPGNGSAGGWARTPVRPVEDGWAERFPRLRGLNLLRAWGLTPGLPQDAFEAVRADVVVTVLEDLAFSRGAATFARRRGLPLVVILHDPPGLFTPGTRWSAGAIRRGFADLYRQAAVRYCVCDGMAEEALRRYGAPADVLPPIPELAKPLPPPGRPPAAGRPPVLGYGGSIGPFYRPRLDAVVAALRAVGGTLLLCARGTPPDSWAGVVRHLGYPEVGEAWRLLREGADALLVAAPDTSAANPYRAMAYQSFPSKLPDTLSQGVPVVLLAEKDTSLGRWAAGHAGRVLALDPAEPGSWPSALGTLSGPGASATALATGAALAAGDFDPALWRGRFRERLRSLAGVRP